MFNPLPLLFVLAPVVLSTALPSSDLTLLPSSAAVSLNPRAIAVIFRRQGCATGKVACGTGCIPNLASNTCCGTYYCDSGRGCDTDGACTCLSTEKKCGTGCIPTAASCCPLDLRYCDAGKYCSPVKGYCCNNGEDPSACAVRQGFTLPATVQTATSTAIVKTSSTLSAANGFTSIATTTSAPKPSVTSDQLSTTKLVPTSTSTLIAFGTASTTSSTPSATANSSSNSFFSSAAHIGGVTGGGIALIVGIAVGIFCCFCSGGARRRRAAAAPAPIQTGGAPGYYQQPVAPEKNVNPQVYPVYQGQGGYAQPPPGQQGGMHFPQGPPQQGPVVYAAPTGPPPPQSPAPDYRSANMSPVSPQTYSPPPHPQQVYNPGYQGQPVAPHYPSGVSEMDGSHQSDPIRR